MEIISSRFSPARLEATPEQRQALNRQAEAIKGVVAEVVQKKIAGGKPFKKERDVSDALDPVVRSFFEGEGYKRTPTKFRGLWRNPNSDHAFVSEGGRWPGKLFVELKCDVDIKAPLVQVSENLAADPSAAVLQIRVPGKPTKEPGAVSIAKSKMESSLPVKYVEVRGW